MRCCSPKGALRHVILAAAFSLVAVPANAQQARVATLGVALPTAATAQPPSNSQGPCCPAPSGVGPGGTTSPDTTAGSPQNGTAAETGMGNAAAPSFANSSFGAGLGTNVALGATGGGGAGGAGSNGVVNGAPLNSPAVPVIFPGLLTSTVPQSAAALDRVFFNYGYVDGFQAVRSQIVPNPTQVNPFITGREAGFNLNVFTVGIEKSFLDGMASVYVSLPFLDATQNITGQAIDGLSDVNVGLKGVLLGSLEQGRLLSAGLTVSAPTARDTVVPTQLIIQCQDPKHPNQCLIVNSTTTTVNPTYLQPYVAGLYVWDRLIVNTYLGGIVPTDDRVATLINGNLSVGYQVYRSCWESWLTSVTPSFGVQTLLPTNHQGTPPTIPTTSLTLPVGATSPTNVSTVGNPTFGFSDEVFLSGGVLFGLGQRTQLSTSVVVPVSGPRAYNYNVCVGLNFLY